MTAGTIAARYIFTEELNAEHHIYLVESKETGELFVEKVLNVFSKDIYRQLADIELPGIPKIIEYEMSEDCLTVIEEYVPGKLLSALIGCGRLKLSYALEISISLCNTLDALHSIDPPIVHRDIKPSNIILADDGRTVLIDYNAAKFSNTAEARDTVLLGTEGYAAPEQYGFGSSTPKTDIYAMGILIKEMCSNIDGYDGCLDDLVSNCTKLDPEKRISSAKALKRSLKAVQRKCIRLGSVDIGYSKLEKWLPPGFKSLSPFRMLPAGIGYLLWAINCFTLDTQLGKGESLIVSIISFLWGLFLVWIPMNYLDVQKLMPLCKSDKISLRVLGIILLIILFMAVVFAVGLIIDVYFVT